MTTPPHREAARVIALDDGHRVLLLHYDEGGSFWATRGGSLETGEHHSTTELRELHEELGVNAKDGALSGQLAERSQDHGVGRREVRQAERYFLALAPEDVDPPEPPSPTTSRPSAGGRWRNCVAPGRGSTPSA